MPRIPAIIRSLQQPQDYTTTWQAMRDFTNNRHSDTLDEIWFLEHNPVYTLGQAGKKEHLLKPSDIPIVKSDRGGQVTYHGPGQLIVYLLLDLKRLHIGVRDLVDNIEQTIVDTLQAWSIEAYSRKDAPGVYVQEKKIAALGLRIRKGYSYHGLALNRDMDLSPFLNINPCGYAGMEVTQMRDICDNQNHEQDISRCHAETVLLQSLLNTLNLSNAEH